MAKYKLIIWDWNGTLFDDLDICIKVMNGVLESRNLPQLSTTRYKEIFGFPVKQYYKKLGFDFNIEPFENISTEYITEYQKRSFSGKLNNNSISVLKQIRCSGIRQVILSASQLENLVEQVQHFGIIEYFDKLIGLDHCHATSKADIGKRWLHESGYDKKDVLMVGDTVHDFETACELGCDCVLLSNGHQSQERVSCLGVPVINSLEELLKFI